MSAIKNLKDSTPDAFPKCIVRNFTGAIIFFFVNSNALIGLLSDKQNNSDKAVDLIQKTALCVQEYINKHISGSELEKRYQALLPELKAQNLSEDFEKLWVKVNEIRRIRDENAGIAKHVDELADFAIEQSNKFIQQVVPKLADESTKASVGNLETLVIIGANVNTSSNYQLKVLFSRLQADLNEKQTLLALFSTLLENDEKDMKSLAGTPFEALPKNAKESVLKMRDLTNSYVKNAEAALSVQQAVFDGIDARLKEIQDIKNKSNVELFSQLKNYFRNMLIIILVTSLIGILTSLLTVRSVSSALKGIIGGMTGASTEVATAVGTAVRGQPLSRRWSFAAGCRHRGDLLIFGRDGLHDKAECRKCQPGQCTDEQDQADCRPSQRIDGAPDRLHGGDFKSQRSDLEDHQDN